MAVSYTISVPTEIIGLLSEVLNHLALAVLFLEKKKRIKEQAVTNGDHYLVSYI